MSNTPLPPQQRAERMKVLEEEVDQLQRVEEVLIAREGAERSTNCAPEAVLGVRVADAHAAPPPVWMMAANPARCRSGIRRK